jgi:hypothetical protein
MEAIWASLMVHTQPAVSKPSVDGILQIDRFWNGLLIKGFPNLFSFCKKNFFEEKLWVVWLNSHRRAAHRTGQPNVKTGYGPYDPGTYPQPTLFMCWT